MSNIILFHIIFLGVPTKIKSKLGNIPLQELVKELGFHYLKEQGQKVTFKVADKLQKKAEDLFKDFSVYGSRVGNISNGQNSYTNNNYSNISYRHESSSRSLGPESRIFKTRLNVGRPTSSGILRKSETCESVSKTLVDTDRDYIQTKFRKTLTTTFGFNQRTFDFLLGDTHMKVGDYAFLYEPVKPTFESKLGTLGIYGDVIFEHIRLTLKSETDYYTVIAKIHLAKILDVDYDVTDVVENTFNKDLRNQEKFKIPIDRQVKIPQKYNDFKYQVSTDLKGTPQSSDWFKDNVQIVKTFQRSLGPSDIWNFDYYLHCGPGINLNRIFESSSIEKRKQHPTSYFFIIELQGDPRASITRTEDGENFNGTAPGRITYGFQRRIRFLKMKYSESPIEVLTFREFLKYDEDFENEKFKNYFTPNREKTLNIDYEDINVTKELNNTLEYQLRYGEGRLTVYLDPKLSNFLQNIVSESNDESYEGTGGKPPKYNESDESEDEDSDLSNLRGSQSNQNYKDYDEENN